MANPCNITINTVSDNNVHTITTVTGTASGCSQVQVDIVCGSGGSSGGGAITNVSANGTWTAHIKPTSKCPCGTPVTIIAKAYPSPQCRAAWSGTIPCENPNTGQSCCPLFDIATSFGPCIDGTRQVTINYTVYPPTNQACYSDAQYSWEINFPNTAQPSILYAYPPGNIVQGSVVLTLPIGTHQVIRFTPAVGNGLGCQDIEKSFDVPNCDCCPNAIADISSVIKEQCNADGKTKNVKVEAVITPTPKPNCPTNIQAEMWIDDNLVATGSGTNSFVLTYQNDFECLEHTVTIKYPGSDCPDVSGTFCVSVCEQSHCRIKRVNFQIALVTSLISGLLYSFKTMYNYLLYAAIIALVIAVFLYIIWKPCRKICRKCPHWLAVWQIALATFSGFLLLGKSSFQTAYTFLSYYVGSTVAVLLIILTLILILLLIYYLYRNWVLKCCPTDCEKWSYVYEALVNICIVSTSVVAGIIGLFYGAAVLNTFWLPHYTFFWALLIYFVWVKKIQKCI